MTAETMTAATMTWEMVVGLEVHCELRTQTKLFCGCRNAFGDPPNTNVCPVCLGLPGSLPVINEQAVDYAMRIGAALGCDIRRSIFHYSALILAVLITFDHLLLSSLMN